MACLKSLIVTSAVWVCLIYSNVTFAKIEQLHFVNNTTEPVVITDLVKDDMVSYLSNHTVQVAPGQDVFWLVKFPDNMMLSPEIEKFDPPKYGLYQLDVHVHDQVACQWLYINEQDLLKRSHVHSIFNVMSLGYSFDLDHLETDSIDDTIPSVLVLIKDDKTINYLHTTLHNKY